MTSIIGNGGISTIAIMLLPNPSSRNTAALAKPNSCQTKTARSQLAQIQACGDETGGQKIVIDRRTQRLAVVHAPVQIESLQVQRRYLQKYDIQIGLVAAVDSEVHVSPYSKEAADDRPK